MLDFLVAVAGTLMRRGKTYGLCPLTPEKTALVLQAFGIDRSYQIYHIAAGEIYGGQRRMAALTLA
jgi:hypothetical protein